MQWQQQQKQWGCPEGRIGKKEAAGRRKGDNRELGRLLVREERQGGLGVNHVDLIDGNDVISK